MKIVFNRREQEVGEGTTITKLVQQLNFNPATVAVELNGQLLLHEEYNRELHPGDRVELVLNMGGGV